MAPTNFATSPSPPAAMSMFPRLLSRPRSVYGGVRFIKLISCRFGALRVFDDPKVQEGIREQLFAQRLAENRRKVEQELLRRAAIVPEISWFRR
jgi:hypothetical protein